jgi:hypothetical protein
LRESVRHRNLGHRTCPPLDGDAAYDLGNTSHAATLEGEGLREGPGVLDHPSAGRSIEGEARDETRRTILELIEANSGRSSGSQLDRRPSDSGGDHAGRLMPPLRELVADGLIESAPGPDPARPASSITGAGVSAMRTAGPYEA